MLNDIAMESLRSLLNRAKSELGGGWFYLPSESKNWTLDTKGILIDCDTLDNDKINDSGEPIYAVERNLVCTLDAAIIEDIVSFAGTIGVSVTDEVLLESFIYYYVHDAFLPEPGFQPLPIEEALLEMDREFYDLLGVERVSTKCRVSECARGTISYSVFCKVHHFEMIQKKPCPFID